jgi:DNA-directed RNA polymerase subunit omega
MIIYPSMESLDSKTDSIYTLVILAARRARTINIDGKKMLNEYKTENPVSKSLEEIAAGKILYKNKYYNRIK